MIPAYKVTARHSTLAQRCLIVEANSDDEAVRLFLVANGVATARTAVVAGMRGSAPRCTVLGGTVTVTVEEADADCVADLPEYPASSPRVPNAAPRRSRRETELSERRLPSNADAVP